MQNTSTNKRRKTAFKFTANQGSGHSMDTTTNTTITTASILPTCTCTTGLK